MNSDRDQTKRMQTVVYMLNDIVICHFRKVFKRRQKQVTLDRFYTKRKEQPVITPPPPKRLGRKTTPPVELPDVFMEEDSPSKK